MKVYNKRGVHNYKEKKLEEALLAFFDKNPDKIGSYTVPTNYEDLKAAHDSLCIESVEFEETKNDPENSTEQEHRNFRDSMTPDTEDQHQMADPMNRDEPIIRDYVKNDGFKEEAGANQTSSNYDEPTSFKDSFEIPDDVGSQGPAGAQQQIHTPPPKQKQQAGPPDPDAKLKKKSKRKFTKYAIDALCALSGRAIVWYATKDITDQKLEEYVQNDVIAKASLEMLVTLENGSRGTVRQFFQSQCLTAQQLATFTQEEKDDLIEAFDDFLEYKKIEINPSVNALVIFAGIMFERALGAMAVKASGTSVLEQLKDQYNAYKEDHSQYQPEPGHEQTSSQQSEQEEGEMPDLSEDLKNDNELTEKDIVAKAD